MENGTPKPGETVTPQAPENGTQTPAPSQGNAGDVTELEKLRKERDQAQMRANQLEKEKQARDTAEADRKAKELEEQNEFKTLYEQEKVKREAIETEREADERRKELSKVKDETLSKYSDEVKALAKEAGMTLDSADEAAVTAFQEKLENIQKMVGNGKVGPNNPRKPMGKPELSGDELKLALKDPAKFQEIISQRPGIAQMMTKR